jgi:hypothetical protein
MRGKERQDSNQHPLNTNPSIKSHKNLGFADSQNMEPLNSMVPKVRKPHLVLFCRLCCFCVVQQCLGGHGHKSGDKMGLHVHA